MHGVFALLRSAEYTSPHSHAWDPSAHLGVDDVLWGADGSLSIRIESSKTDPFKSGVHIHLTELDSQLCPVDALRKYLSVRGLGRGPFFVFSDGSFLTRAQRSSLIKLCFPQVSLVTHSFCIGGATAAARAGLPDSLIQLLGRWKSNTFKKYIRASLHLEIAGHSAISRG